MPLHSITIGFGTLDRVIFVIKRIIHESHKIEMILRPLSSALKKQPYPTAIFGNIRQHFVGW